VCRCVCVCVWMWVGVLGREVKVSDSSLAVLNATTRKVLLKLYLDFALRPLLFFGVLH